MPERITRRGAELCGVRGWLKFFVTIHLYVLPVLFVLQHILAWVGFSILSEDYPGIVMVGLIETVVSAIFVYRWVQIAGALRDIKPGVIQEAKAWLKYGLAWNFLSIPLTFLSGLPADDLMLGGVKSAVGGLIGFALWYSYFNVSKRVAATYPDSRA